MKRFQANSLAFVLLATGVVPSLWAESPALVSARTQYEQRSQSIQSQDQEIETLSKQLDRVSAQIRSLKSKKRTLLLDYRLQSNLQEAQRLSDRLQSMAKQRSEWDASLRVERKSLLKAIDSEVDQLRETAGARSEPSDRRRVAAQEMERLNWERMRLSTADIAEPLPSSARALMGNGDTPEEAQERITAIRDFEQRLKREMKTMEEELKQIKRQRFLRAEVAHLMDEEAFFGERGFVSGGPVRGDKNNTVSSTRANTAANNNPTNPSATSSPTATGNEINPAIVPSPGAPTTVLDPTISTLSPAPREEARDPLAQLASEFGLSSEHTRALSPRTTGEHDQIHWLERRLGATKQILTLLEEKVRKIEERHLH